MAFMRRGEIDGQGCGPDLRLYVGDRTQKERRLDRKALSQCCHRAKFCTDAIQDWVCEAPSDDDCIRAKFRLITRMSLRN